MKNFNAVILGLLALVIAVFTADQIIGKRDSHARDPRDNQAIAERIRPQGQITITMPSYPAPITPPVEEVSTPAPIAVTNPTDASLPAAVADLAKSKEIYIATCFACHETGAAGAPKRGDQSVWPSRVVQGKKSLLLHVLNGFNDMPSRGGNPNLSDEEIAMALAYLLLEIEINQ